MNEHLLPFEGTCDYRRMMQGLNRCGYAGALTLEVNNMRHRDMCHEDFLSHRYGLIKKYRSYEKKCIFGMFLRDNSI